MEREPEKALLTSVLHVAPHIEKDGALSAAQADDAAGLFVAQLAAPSAVRLGGGDEVVLWDVATGSQAVTRPDPAGGWTVRQRGPLRLWDAVEHAVLAWQNAGSPHQSAYGFTVTADRQYVWLGEPDGPSWDLPV